MQLSHCLFLWIQFFKNAKKIVSLKSALLIFYTFLIFMTNARTPVAMYWGLLGLFVVTVIAFTRKKYLKQLQAFLQFLLFHFCCP